ncbi:MAG: hypothetical protein PHS41_11200 [Victivallaceae bacterium]|nr:hypothetical protein [Victivallaceae bacterium]
MPITLLLQLRQPMDFSLCDIAKKARGGVRIGIVQQRRTLVQVFQCRKIIWKYRRKILSITVVAYFIQIFHPVLVQGKSGKVFFCGVKGIAVFRNLRLRGKTGCFVFRPIHAKSRLLRQVFFQLGQKVRRGVGIGKLCAKGYFPIGAREINANYEMICRVAGVEFDMQYFRSENRISPFPGQLLFRQKFNQIFAFQKKHIERLNLLLQLIRQRVGLFLQGPMQVVAGADQRKKALFFRMAQLIYGFVQSLLHQGHVFSVELQCFQPEAVIAFKNSHLDCPIFGIPKHGKKRCARELGTAGKIFRTELLSQKLFAFQRVQPGSLDKFITAAVLGQKHFSQRFGLRPIGDERNFFCGAEHCGKGEQQGKNPILHRLRVR